MTSRTTPQEVEDIKLVLHSQWFPEDPLCFHRVGEGYSDVVERIRPDILVEDDCGSLGGTAEMIITHLQPDVRKKITSIVVKEFGGVDHRPDDLVSLNAGSTHRFQTAVFRKP